MLSVKNLSFSFSKEALVLWNVSLNLNKGETLAIVGASGCGKSTLLRLVSGILPNSKSDTFSGTIAIDGALPNDYIKKGKLAFMFQEATLMPNLTVKENIALPLKIKGIMDDAKVNDLIATVGLTEYANYLPNQLSGGMKTRVSLARSFVTQPELLLLDEPFSALDIAWKSKLYVELEKLRNKHNTTVVIVTHDVQEALLLSNQVVVLSRFGEVKAKHQIVSGMSLTERVNDISGFMANVYTNYYLPIQQAIMLDGNRKTISKSEVFQVLESLKSVAGNEQLETNYSETAIDNIREYSNDAEVNNILVTFFNKAKTPKLKYQLVWDILEYEHLSEDTHNDILNYYFENIDCFSSWTKEWFALRNSNENTLSFLEILKGRIDANNEFRNAKKWIYLCDLYAVKQLPETIAYLMLVINSEVENLNYPFAKKVAKMVKEKIEHEKKNYISVA